ncbi:MAG: glycosyltransferase [Gammaproteobacteria bacterium]
MAWLENRYRIKRKKMLTPKISIIIPAFNVERYVGACLKSARQQTLSEIEIICVDDGSTDGTSQVLRKHARADDRIRILENDVNHGEGVARNGGIEAARGEYLFYLDADDAIPEYALAVLYAEASNNGSEMVKGCVAMMQEDGKVTKTSGLCVNMPIRNTNIYESDLLRRIPGSHCSYLYKRCFLDKQGIRYPADLVMGGDLVMLAQCLVCASRVTLIPDVVYHYRQSTGSMTRRQVSAKIAIDSIRAKKRVIDLLRAEGLEEAAEWIIRNWWRYDITQFWLRGTEALDSSQYKMIFAEFREAVRPVNTPWNPTIPAAFIYLISLILTNRNEDAIEFLSTEMQTDQWHDNKRLKQMLKFVVQRAPDDESAVLKLAGVYAREGELKRAQELLGQIVGLHPTHILARLEYAKVLRRRGQRTKAEASLDRALADWLAGERENAKLLQKVLSEKERLIRDRFSIKSADAKAEEEILTHESRAAKKEMMRLQIEVTQWKERCGALEKVVSERDEELTLVNNQLAEILSSFPWRLATALRRARGR